MEVPEPKGERVLPEEELWAAGPDSSRGWSEGLEEHGCRVPTGVRGERSFGLNTGLAAVLWRLDLVVVRC